jgi:hypothetical protein
MLSAHHIPQPRGPSFDFCAKGVISPHMAADAFAFPIKNKVHSQIRSALNDHD